MVHKMTVHRLDTKVYFGQKAFIEKNGKVLVLRDPLALVAGQSGLDFPGGKYRWTESLEDGLRREVKEETSLEIEIGKPFFVWTSHRLRLKIKSQPMVYLGYMCRYKSGEIKLSGEHIEYGWVDKSTYRRWKDQSDDFKALEAYFKLKGT